jgi:5'-nucleotidase / UDP-sugar diphosphatase
MPKKFISLILLLILGLPITAYCSEDAVITIVHTNDTYGRLLPFTRDGIELGGVIRRAYIINQIRREVKDNLVVLDAGDAIAPYPLSAFDQGKTVIQMMNEMGYTAMALGNHEFDYGVDILRERINDAKFSILSANVIDKGTEKPLCQPYMKTEVSGVKIGIIGLTTPTTSYRAAPHLQKSMTYSDPFVAAKNAVKELKSQGCDFIIALSHLGYQSDMELSAQVAGLNLIVGGEIRSYDDKLITLMSPVDYSAGATIVYCPWFGGHVGRIDVSLEKQANGSYIVKKMDAKKYRLDRDTYPIITASADVPEIVSQLDHLDKTYNSKYQGIIGKVAKNEEISTLELIPLIMRKKTETEIALLNKGSLKVDTLRDNIMRIQAIESVQYPNQIYILELSGEQLKSAIAHSAKQFNENRRLVFSGLENNGSMVNGRTLNADEYYTVATNDFLAFGGDDYNMIANGRKKKNTGFMLQEVVLDYLQGVESSGQMLSLAPLRDSLNGLVIKTRTDLELLVEGLKVSQTAEKYSQISLLQSKNVGNFLYWNTKGNFSMLFASSKYYVDANLCSKYGRIQHPQIRSSDSLEMEDNTQIAIIFKLLPGKWILDPIARFEVENIEFTDSADVNPVTQISAGVERQLFSGMKVSTGLLARRQRPEKTDQTQVNFDIRANYEVKIRNIPFKSELKFFPVFRDTASDDPFFKNYITSFANNIKFPLNKYLLFYANVIFYRETQVGSWAHKAEFAIQVAQRWGRKS